MLDFIVQLIFYACIGLLFYPVILFYIVVIVVLYYGIRDWNKGKK